MRRLIVRALLAALNSRWLNATPCKYGFIGNLDTFSIENLRYEVRSRPELTVATLIAESELFKNCAGRVGNLAFGVIEGAEMRDGTIWDVHELRQAVVREYADLINPTDPSLKPEANAPHPATPELTAALDADKWQAPHRLLVYAMKRYISIHGAETALAAAQLVAEGLPCDSGTAVDERVKENRRAKIFHPAGPA